MNIPMNAVINSSYSTPQVESREGRYEVLSESKVENKGASISQGQEKRVLEAIEKANGKLDGGEKEFKFSVHEETKQIMIKVVDTLTNDVVLEFPSEKILDIVADMCERVGLFIDEKR